MNRVKIIVFLLLALSAVSLFAQAKPRLAILPFTGGSPEDAETIAEFFSYEDEINRVFTPVPRTRAIETLMKEQEFQRSGLTDSDTIADLGKQLNADYVLAGHIAVLGGSSKLLLITIIDVKELQQIAGDYREYERIESVIDVMSGMAKQITGAAVRDSSALPRLAVLPFNVLSSGMDLGDAELLAQLLATELANSGRYAVFPRAKAIEKVMEEHHIERSGMTDVESIKAIGEAVNAQYVLSANVRKLGDDNFFSASVLHIVDASQKQGVYEQYQTATDGLTLMPKIAQVLSGTGSITVRSAVAGTVVVDGRNTGVTVEEGGAAVVSNVNADTVSVAVQMAGGQLVQGPSVTVQAGQTADVRIERPAPSVPSGTDEARARAEEAAKAAAAARTEEAARAAAAARAEEAARAAAAAKAEEPAKARALRNSRVSSGSDFMRVAAEINALSIPGTYRITLTNSVAAGPVIFSSGTVEKTIVIRGNTALRTVTNTGTGNLFTVGSGNTLALERNIKLDGNNREHHVVLINEGGTLVMKAGSHLEGAKAIGVYVNNGGRFTMENGTISGNTAQTGSGVYINNGMFTMSGGSVTGNVAQHGGGVAVFGGRFTMEGGTISGNTAGNTGGGVYAGEGSTFTVSGGTINGNTAVAGGGVYATKGTFTMSGGTISGNTVNRGGGGVYAGEGSTFTMSGGTINRNTATWGGGVYAGASGRFTMSRGMIDGNTANDLGGGVYLNSDSSRFTKSGGTIGGNNKASRGDVVFGGSFSKLREWAAGPGVNMDSNVNGSAGGWR
jgi:TolB-like protein